MQTEQCRARNLFIKRKNVTRRLPIWRMEIGALKTRIAPHSNEGELKNSENSPFDLRPVSPPDRGYSLNIRGSIKSCKLERGFSWFSYSGLASRLLTIRILASLVRPLDWTLKNSSTEKKFAQRTMAN